MTARGLPQALGDSVGHQPSSEGEVYSSGELMALVKPAVHLQRRLLRTYRNLAWADLGDSSCIAQVDDCRVTLAPKWRGRWLVVVMHKNGHGPPYP